MNLLKRLIAWTLLSSIATLANAAPDPNDSIFAKALSTGQAQAPIPPNVIDPSIIERLQRSTGSDTPLALQVMRVERFTQQSRCGRVRFVIMQPATKIFWRDLGGELNICDDNSPPWQVCQDNPKLLVPPNGNCKDGSKPTDTPEVKAAISAALTRGGLTRDQVKQQLKPPRGQ